MNNIQFKLKVTFLRESIDNPEITGVKLTSLYKTRDEVKFLSLTYRYRDMTTAKYSAMPSGLYRKDNTIFGSCLPSLVSSSFYPTGSDDYRRKQFRKAVISDPYFYDRFFSIYNIPNIFQSDISALLNVAPAGIKKLLISRIAQSNPK